MAWKVISAPQSGEPSDTALNVVKDLGVMKQAPLSFNQDGWIVFKNKKIGFINAQGEETVPAKYPWLHLHNFTNERKSDGYLTIAEHSWPQNQFQDIATLPYDHYVSELMFGLGGYWPPRPWFFDSSTETIVYREYREDNSYQTVPLCEVDPSIYAAYADYDMIKLGNQDSRKKNFWIWQPKTGKVTGPFRSDGLYSIPGASTQSVDAEGGYSFCGNWAEPYGGDSSTMQIFEIGSPSYRRYVLYNPMENSGLVGFDELKVNMYGTVGRIGRSTYVYDENGNLMYSGDFEDAGMPVGNLVPVKTDGTWKLVTLESVQKQQPTDPHKPFTVTDLVRSIPAK
ncbi:WG repeat-containing protein [Allobaculum mucilyticum]|nr:WG repeat-containing protein [Allobaculum mucilyticum]